MAKKQGRHAKKGGRTTPKGTRPLQLVHSSQRQVRRPEPGLMATVAEALRQPDPLDLLGLVSSMVWFASPGIPGRPPDLPTVDTLVELWAELDDRAATALLRAVAALGDRVELRTAATAAVAGRTHALPAWVEGLDQVSVTRVVEVGHVLGDGEALLLDLAIPGSAGVTLDVYVDHNIGTFVKSAFLAPESLDTVLLRMADLLSESGTTVTDLSPADAKAKLADALANPLSGGLLPVDEDDDSSWPRSRPVVEWIVRGLPPGGTGYVRSEWSDADLDELVEGFFASPWGRALRDGERRRLLDLLVERASDDDDPMRWSPVRVEVIASEMLVMGPELFPDAIASAPDLLRAFVGYCHDERGVPAELTDETMAAVDRWVPQLRRMADELDDGYDDPDPMWSWGAELLAELVAATGSVEALRALEVEALPDEPFSWGDVPPEAVAAIEPIVALVEEVCERLFDLELRTAARRLVARLAAADATLFTRRSRLESTVAAVVWMAASANDAFTAHGVLVKDLCADLRVSGTPSQRADTFLRALPGAHRGYQTIGLGSTDLLTSNGRASLIGRRERGLRLLARDLLEPDGWLARGLDDVVIDDPDVLWKLVEARVRLPR